MLQEKTFAAGAANLNYLDYGPSSATPLVMLHGGAWRWQEYLSLIPSLGQLWHIYALDLRGNGRSGWVPNKYRLQDFTEDNSEFVRRLKAPAVIVGHSIGGVVALMLAARHPEQIKGLIIEDAPLTLVNYKRIIESSRDMFRGWLNLKSSAQSEQELTLLLADAFKDYPGVTSSWIMFFAGCLWQLDPTFFNVLLHDFNGFTDGYDYAHIFANIRCRVLFLRGETNLGAVMADDEITWLQQNCSNVKCVSINGVGHLLHLENHGQRPVLTEMFTFLKNI
jgi:pimeloyl-ACP methyl ester carboxylesterase